VLDRRWLVQRNESRVRLQRWIRGGSCYGLCFVATTSYYASDDHLSNGEQLLGCESHTRGRVLMHDKGFGSCVSPTLCACNFGYVNNNVSGCVFTPASERTALWSGARLIFSCVVMLTKAMSTKSTAFPVYAIVIIASKSNCGLHNRRSCLFKCNATRTVLGVLLLSGLIMVIIYKKSRGPLAQRVRVPGLQCVF
jgi:hypothetical protein